MDVKLSRRLTLKKSQHLRHPCWFKHRLQGRNVKNSALNSTVWQQKSKDMNQSGADVFSNYIPDLVSVIFSLLYLVRREMRRDRCPTKALV